MMLRHGMRSCAIVCRRAVTNLSSADTAHHYPTQLIVRRERAQVVPFGLSVRPCSTVAGGDETDTLFSSVELELRGHDNSVLDSYITFLRSACDHLDVQVGAVETLPTIKWLQNVLKSKHVHKKHKVQYETRTNVRRVELLRLTGSTASTVLEYVQRNLPEGVAMKVTHHELCPRPNYLI